MTTSRTSADRAVVPGVPAPRRPQERLEHVEALRRAATHLAAAQLLERRAEASANPVLGDLLRERARERRCRGARVLAGLGVRPVRRPPTAPRC
ncbi:hypothetical protein [Geodermatophilus normandii]|uniref:Uncharacterized protein n=1 Tax=Geodermatophilus normandii TaxID=1137989 RepID=A0A6P0GBC9_9ACTN|nr:hypothetical protein [Geodermatophilus normandii]NEM05492.1 hypothetical protein [Geodermatophilus normandii]